MIDATVVGSGPNGLAAAVVLARAGLEVDLVEANDQIGGGLRSAPFEANQDVCFDAGSAVHPFITESEFFRQWEATKRVEYFSPEISFAHPLHDGRAGLAYRDVVRTAEGLGRDGRVWRRMFEPMAENPGNTGNLALSPAVLGLRQPLLFSQMGVRAVASALLGDRLFREDLAPAMLAGVMAHANTKLPTLAGASVGLVLTALAHGRGWQLPVGGTQRLADALAADFTSHGGRIRTGETIRTWNDMEPSRAVIFNTSLSAASRIAADRLPRSYRSFLERARSGNGIFKVDYLTSEPVPWINADVRNSPTVHLGGSAGEVMSVESGVSEGHHPEAPYVLLVQPTVVDPARAPDKAVVWAYCHLPAGSTRDMNEQITTQIERFAPGFRDTILAQQSSSPKQLQHANPNLRGGDIGGGSMAGLDFVRRPTLGLHPWRTPAKEIYLSSSYVSPGPGVHAMGGYYAAKEALLQTFGLPMPALGTGPRFEP